MSEANEVGSDAGDASEQPLSPSSDSAGETRWEQRSGWIAETAEPAASTPPVAPPPTRPVRTRSRIVAAATGESTDPTPVRPAAATADNGADASIDLTTPTPPALPPPIGGHPADPTPELVDLRSHEVRSLLEDGVSTASETDASPSGPGSPAPSASPVSQKWGASRPAATVEPSPVRIEEPVPESKYGPSLVSLSDATDPGLLLTPVLAPTPDPEPEVVPAPSVPSAALSEEQVEEVRSQDSPDESEAAAASAAAVPSTRPGGPTTTGDRPKPGPRPTGEPVTSKFGMAPVPMEPTPPEAGADVPPAEVATRSLAPVGGPPATIENESSGNSRLLTSGLFIVALALSVAAGILGALWQRERSTNEDLRAEMVALAEADPNEAADIEALLDQNRTLELQNQELQRERDELQTLVAPVPEGRISEIDVPFVPAQVDEFRDRLIAVDANGEYAVWGTGVAGGITDSGTVAGPPSSMFAHRDNAWIATEQGGIEVISLIDGSDVLAIATAEVSLIVPSSRTVWSFVPGSRELRRHRETNGNVRATVTLPVEIRELSSGAGAIWALGEDGLVYRVNTADLTVAPIPAGQEVVSIAAGTDALWALSAADGSLRRVDAVSGEVLVTVPVGRDPIAVEFSGESVWVALRSGETLIEVDTRTAAVVSRTSLPGVPLDVTSGSTGVLVTLEGDVPLVRVASIGGDEATTLLESDAEAAGDDAAADGTEDAATDG